MTRNAALNWLDGRGWLVLTGNAPASESIRARTLGIAAADGAVAVVAVHGEDAAAEQLLVDMEDLGAHAGYLVDVLAEDDLAVHEKLAEASVVIISAQDQATNVRSVIVGAAIEGIQTAFENGAVVLVEGPGAMAFGEWVVAEDGIIAGLEWLRGTLVVPGAERVADVEIVQAVLAARRSGVAIGIGVESALALGPDGQVELWGRQQVTIALGPDFGA